MLCGPSGCGKTTILRLLKPEIRPHGSLSGTILYQENELNEEGSVEIGFVFQDPEHQIVMDEVQNELAFGMENLGLSSDVMCRRLAEIVQLFDLEPLLHRKTDQLSGGEKQLLNLASVLMMQPKVILLDEPTAQLDPIATRHLLQILKQLNQEWGITIVLVEHRLDELLPMVDQVLFLQAGQITYCGTSEELVKWLWSSLEEMHAFIPTVPKMVLGWEEKVDSNLPLSVKQGRQWWLNKGRHLSSTLNGPEKKTDELTTRKLVELKEIYFRYRYEEKEVFQQLNLEVNQGEVLAILGRNGSGKSTLLHILAEQIIPQRGNVTWFRKTKTAFLPQNPKALFVHDSVDMGIQSICDMYSLTSREVGEIFEELQIKPILHHHPHDLSGGELQRAALAVLLCTKPQILLLDEPTKGLDPVAKANLLNFLQRLRRRGITIVLVTHDLEFAVQLATRCALLFDGKITAIDRSATFFAESFFYTTFLQRVLRGTALCHISTWKEFKKICRAPSTPS